MTQNKNEDSSDRLLRETTELTDLLKQYLKLEAIEKLTIATTLLIVGGVVFILAWCAVFYLSSGLVKNISEWVGSEAGANYIVGGILVVFLIIFYICRKSLVESRVVKGISELILKETEDEDEEQ